jgi:hypothetical protein
MTYPVSETYSYTMERKYEETTGKLISVVHSTVTRTKVVLPISMTMSSFVLPAVSKETVYKLSPSVKG